MNLVMGISDHVHVLNFGRDDRRGPAGRGAREPGRDRGLPRHRRARSRKALDAPPETDRWRQRSRMALLELTRRRGPLRAGAGPARRLARGRRGPDRGGARRERGGQDDDAARDLGHGQADAARSCSTAARSAAAGPEAVAKLGVAHVPEGPRHVLGAVGRGEPPPRRLHAARLARRRHRADERLLPLDRRAARPARRHALRRRAADARARPRADGPPAAAAARRAVARARAARHA